MPRVKRSVNAKKKRKKTLKLTKGFRWGRKNKYKAAKDALRHALAYSYRDRRNKKRDFRRLWQIKINAAAKSQDISYSRFIDALKKNKIDLDRKILADLAENNPDIFLQIVEAIKKDIPKPKLEEAKDKAKKEETEEKK